MLILGDEFSIEDLSSAKFVICDNLQQAFNLLQTLSESTEIRKKFGFLLRWGQLTLDEKLANYGKFASHELNFFTFAKDPQFFEEIVAPHLRNKKDTTFLDKWFLGYDLSSYLSPYRFASLNAFEKILLGMNTNKST